MMRGINQAMKTTIRRAAIPLRKEITNEIRREKRLTVGEIKRKHLRMNKKLNGPMSSWEVNVDVLDVKIPLLQFIKGKKTPRNQRGRKVKRRSVLRAEVRPGSRITIQTGFIIRGKSGLQVFKRKTKKAIPIARQMVSSPHHDVEKRDVRDRILDRITKLMTKNFTKNVEFFLGRIK